MLFKDPKLPKRCGAQSAGTCLSFDFSQVNAIMTLRLPKHEFLSTMVNPLVAGEAGNSQEARRQGSRSSEYSAPFQYLDQQCVYICQHFVLKQSVEVLLPVTVLRMRFYNRHPVYNTLARLLKNRTVFSLTVFRSKLSDGNLLPQVFGLQMFLKNRKYSSVFEYTSLVD